MKITLKDIIGLTKELPEECFEETYEKLREIKEKVDTEKEEAPDQCVRCGSANIVRNGKNIRNRPICVKTARNTL